MKSDREWSDWYLGKCRAPIKIQVEPTLWDQARFYVIAVVIASAVILLIVIATAGAEVVYPANLWQGLIAEATSDGYAGMYAVACCVRNRLDKGLSVGLCGLKRRNLAQFCTREGQKKEAMAKKIVREVFENGAPDVTNGATHFESTRYKTPYWARNAEKTVQVGEHVFYRRVK